MALLSPSWMHSTIQCNILQHYCAQHVAHIWPPCGNLLQHLAICWMVLSQVWKWQILVAAVFDGERCCTFLSSSLTTQSDSVARCCIEMLHMFDWAFMSRENNVYLNIGLVKFGLNALSLTLLYLFQWVPPSHKCCPLIKAALK